MKPKHSFTGKVGLQGKHGRFCHRGLLEDIVGFLQDTVVVTSSLTLMLDLHKVGGLHEPGLGGQHAPVEAEEGRGDDGQHDFCVQGLLVEKRAVLVLLVQCSSLCDVAVNPS